MTPPRFDIDGMMDRLGEKRARRAVSYFEQGLVDIVAFEDGRALSIVTGETGHLYTVDVRDDGEGECTCPDYPNERTCKHIGATALAADALSQREARALDGRLSALRDLLAAERREVLFARLLDLARNLPGAIAHLEGPED
jgi:uncharacterized Zn finger protein